METKAFEIRDRWTFIPVLATRMIPNPEPMRGEMGPADYQRSKEAERYLLSRSGFPIDNPPLVMLCRMDANCCSDDASCNAYSWGRVRTMQVAHNHITAFWNSLKSGDVIDVEFILGETTVKKQSEQLTDFRASGQVPQVAGPSHPSSQPDARSL